MKTVLITGSQGFMGKNLLAALKERKDTEVKTFSRNESLESLQESIKEVDVIFHLAGVNRPKEEREFEEGNVGLTEELVNLLEKRRNKPVLVFASSIQAQLDNPYGKSKLKAEKVLTDYSQGTGGTVIIFRLPNVFGKWSKPNYNTVVATFCHNIATGLPIKVSDPSKKLNLVYIDDVVKEFLKVMEETETEKSDPYKEVDKTYQVTLGDLADRINTFKDMREKLFVPNFYDDFNKALYATYLSFLNKKDFSRALDLKSDNRGNLAEVVKSANFGQIFISKTYSGITRGNHYHHTKTEKFCVIQGKAVIKLRHIFAEEVISYYVTGDSPEVVDIPPGYTHSIENTGEEELIVLFWANEVFDQENPDTYYSEV